MGRRSPPVRMGSRSDDLDDLAGADTACADPDAPPGSPDQSVNTLKVGIEATLGKVVGVAYPIAALRPFSANVTNSSHDSFPYLSHRPRPAAFSAPPR